MVATDRVNKLGALLKQTEIRFGRKITSSYNCAQLSEEIQLKTSKYISAQTLRRLFSLVRSTTHPSPFTLDVLSNYCGYQDWYRFCRDGETKGEGTPETFANWVLDFYRAPLSRMWPSADYYIACKNIAERILSDQALLEVVPAQIAKLKSGQILFFECFPYIDGVAHAYKGHLQIYRENKLEDTQAQIFATSLLFLGAYLSQESSEMTKYHCELLAIGCPKQGDIHDIPIARYLGSQILYHCHHGNDGMVDIWLELAIVDYRNYYADLDHGFCNFFLVLSGYLFLAGLYKECIDILGYMDDPKWTKHFSDHPLNLGYREIARLIKSISLIRVGELDEGKRIFKELDPSRFVFTERKLYTIIYLGQKIRSCDKQAGKKKAKLIAEMNVLIDETRFTGLLKYAL